MLALTAVGAIATGTITEAGAIRKACQKADRPAASAELCSCIQTVANRNLSLRERKRVAKWFSDPHQAQVTRQSNHWADEQLWQRYKAFGQDARKLCG
jgi:hypothetical protein